LGLLRGWPLDDAARADQQMREIGSLLEQPPDLQDIGDPGLDAAYTAWAETYDALPNLLIDAEEPLVRSLLDEGGLQGRVALDAACGTGRITRLLRDRGFEIIGVDASSPMLRRSRGRDAASRLAVGDLRRMPLRSASVDLAVCGLALTHVEQLGPPIAELSRVLRPGGRLITTDLHPVATAFGGQTYFRASDGSKHMARNHVHWPSAYAAAFQAAGLAIDRLEELLVDEVFVRAMATPEIRAGAQALIGLPLVIAWRVRKLPAESPRVA